MKIAVQKWKIRKNREKIISWKWLFWELLTGVGFEMGFFRDLGSVSGFLDFGLPRKIPKFPKSRRSGSEFYNTEGKSRNPRDQDFIFSEYPEIPKICVSTVFWPSEFWNYNPRNSGIFRNFGILILRIRDFFALWIFIPVIRDFSKFWGFNPWDSGFFRIFYLRDIAEIFYPRNLDFFVG